MQAQHILLLNCFNTAIANFINISNASLYFKTVLTKCYRNVFKMFSIDDALLIFFRAPADATEECFEEKTKQSLETIILTIKIFREDESTV